MALTMAGIHVAIGPLVSGCYNIIKSISQLEQSYKFMPLTLASIKVTCRMTRSTLRRIDSILTEFPETLNDFSQDFFDELDTIKTECGKIISLLENHLSDLLEVDVSDIPLTTQNASRLDKLKALYNESDMEKLVGQLRYYNADLNYTSTNLLMYVDNKSKSVSG
jgi:hypothetical protein